MTCKLVDTEFSAISRLCNGSLMRCVGGSLVAIESYEDGRQAIVVDGDDI